MYIEICILDVKMTTFKTYNIIMLIYRVCLRQNERKSNRAKVVV